LKKTLILLLRTILWIGLGLLGVFLLFIGIISLRYSPGYMVNEVFKDMGTAYDYRFLPERKLSSSPDPFQFAVDTSKEELVQKTFQANPSIPALDNFLADTGTLAFVVVQNDTVIYERFFKGIQRDSIVTSYSVAKSFDSALIGIAIQEGYIHRADDAITDYIPELAERDPRFKEIQIRDLLTMASGLRYNTDRPLSFGDDNLTYEFDDLRHLALTETQIVGKPGEEFVYNDYNPLLIGMILERATGRSVTAYLQEKLWTPLGMEFDGSWSLDSKASGFEKMESGINARAIDFAKFGRLYLNGGDWNGTQVVPAAWVAASTQNNGLIQGRVLYYGYQWWGENCNPDSHDFFAFGALGQIVYISPAKNMIIVRMGEKYGLKGEIEEWAETLCQFAKAMP
jgi:CubicO group peptidase (beta-lactamase class C family)